MKISLRVCFFAGLLMFESAANPTGSDAFGMELGVCDLLVSHDSKQLEGWKFFNIGSARDLSVIEKVAISSGGEVYLLRDKFRSNEVIVEVANLYFKKYSVLKTFSKEVDVGETLYNLVCFISPSASIGLNVSGAKMDEKVFLSYLKRVNASNIDVSFQNVLEKIEVFTSDSPMKQNTLDLIFFEYDKLIAYRFSFKKDEKKIDSIQISEVFDFSRSGN